jgi:hypothetical protein
LELIQALKNRDPFDGYSQWSATILFAQFQEADGLTSAPDGRLHLSLIRQGYAMSLQIELRNLLMQKSALQR